MPLLKPARATQLNRRHPLARGLVAGWLFNGAKDDFHDFSGNDRMVSVGDGAAQEVAGKHGWCLEFNDASQEYLERNDLCGITGYPFSIACWFWTDSTNNQALVLLGDTDGPRYHGLWLRDPADTDILCHTFISSTSAYAKTSRSYITSTWHSACGVWAGQQDRRVYLDGGNKGTNTIDSEPFSTVDNTTIAARHQNNVVDLYLSGRICCAFIWNRVLSDQEVAWLYREPFCMFEPATRPGFLYVGVGQTVFLTGGLSAQSTGTAALKAARAIAGAVPAQAGANGWLSLPGEVLLTGTIEAGSILSALLAAAYPAQWFQASLHIKKDWLIGALFAGMTANTFKLSTVLSLGWFWLRHDGCSALYRGASMKQIDFVNVLTVTAPGACTVSPPSYLPHNSNSTYFYVIRRFNNCGYQERTLTAAARVCINAQGDLAEPCPNNIFARKAEQIDANKVSLLWFYYPLRQESEPVCFKIYGNGGTGQIDYGNVLAQVDYQGPRFYSFQTDELNTGTYLFVIKAEDSSGMQNGSSAELRIQLVASSPKAPSILSLESI
jgi:hypothetical protein